MVRRATVTDARAIARVQVESWRSAYEGLMPAELLAALSVDERERMWRGVLGSSGAAVLVAEESGALVGFVAVRPRPGDPDVGELLALYIAPSQWRRTIGTLLHNAAVEHLARQGCARAELWVLDGNERAAAFYRARGWIPDGRRQREERPDGFVLPEHGMSLDLRRTGGTARRV
ncbi:GNAT family N-acetyltransferase [Pseudonocardia halophobica]|uniref:N-acetyltransferase n=1 Tax=Pseudonocardia halophobica TaxID=29401 RepID=A0A9W6NX18_9PSEU|nr:GNAT family N-acetyltransferase [Pseudonocardia halophobica]GLL12970.1 N-acetyltransferase [Pseudonocardia halophobica]